MPIAVPVNFRQRRWRPTRRQLVLTTCLITILYLIGYAYLRYRRDFIRTERFENTGPWSHIITHHDIRLGEGRTGLHYESLYVIYWPLRASETAVWRFCQPR
jgi:hypothetical protein